MYGELGACRSINLIIVKKVATSDAKCLLSLGYLSSAVCICSLLSRAKLVNAQTKQSPGSKRANKLVDYIPNRASGFSWVWMILEYIAGYLNLRI